MWFNRIGATQIKGSQDPDVVQFQYACWFCFLKMSWPLKDPTGNVYFCKYFILHVCEQAALSPHERFVNVASMMAFLGGKSTGKEAVPSVPDASSEAVVKVRFQKKTY